MQITNLKNIKDLLEYINLYGIKNVPYRFANKENKLLLINIKLNGGYESSTSLPEIVYRETIQKSQNCQHCNTPLKYSETHKKFLTFCSASCGCSYNKDIVTQKRKAKMLINYSNAEWVSEYKNKISKASRAWHDSTEGIIQNKNHSQIMKTKILNGEFTPDITNSWTKWNAQYNGKKFRSLFEALFYAYTIDRDSSLLYEKIRIPYKYLGDSKIYITDFVSVKNKIIFEIKPSSLKEIELNIVKRDTAIEWCKNNDYTYKIISEDSLKIMINYVCDKEFVIQFRKKYPKWK